jgi:hypothetical protein
MTCKLCRPNACRCNCGYTCGRRCGLPILECMEKHYEADCDHVWDGETWESPDGCAASVTCSQCGTTMMSHDMACGP